MKKKLYIIVSLLVIVLITGAFLNYKYYRQDPGNITSARLSLSDSPSPKAVLSVSEDSTPASEPEATVASQTPRPGTYQIENFPFQSQAPTGNWDQLHDEACEEASLILVNYYLDNKALDASTMENQIQKMVSWENKYFGEHKDLTISETADMAKNFYNLNNYEIKTNITIDEIKDEIAQNHPVILPTAGRLLGNPYFRSPGPVYHMVVAIGYEGNTIIVQDVGTKRGDHYQYSEKILYNAIHDWAGAEDNIESGGKTVLVLGI